jgi:anti-sigma factor RsiW
MWRGKIEPKSFHILEEAFNMRCTRAQRRLEAYLGDEMGGQERARLERHLAACSECARVLERARQLRAVLGDARAPGLPAGFHACLMARASERAARPRWVGRLLRGFGWRSTMSARLRTATVGAVVVALGAGALIGRDMWRFERPAEQARLAVADPVRIYRIDYLGEAPSGSLAGAYVSLLSGGGK